MDAAESVEYHDFILTAKMIHASNLLDLVSTKTSKNVVLADMTFLSNLPFIHRLNDGR